ncbi:collagen alpha-1(XI) chain-like [Coregonus clupeaformis]|uniref:collagen alpha-1(XI) chain-like n=1 Tax=Coregonus clupeaformis TaxID=59861 RepID=UPI001E1C7E17|nr:collagen alpha-1(XI) chain-like [Coregonus clupeaformis]
MLWGLKDIEEMQEFQGNQDLKACRANLCGAKGETGPDGWGWKNWSEGRRKGDKGSFGARGDKGQQGERGTIGPDGIVGRNGPPGIPGSRGEPGPDGDLGVKGGSGPKGVPGAPGPGLTDEQVLQLCKGVVTAQISQYAASIRAKCSQGCPINNRTLIGPPGTRGPTGESGKPGKAGKAGVKGARGIQGDTGMDGQKGAEGERGTKGPKGKGVSLVKVCQDTMGIKASEGCQVTQQSQRKVWQVPEGPVVSQALWASLAWRATQECPASVRHGTAAFTRL